MNPPRITLPSDSPSLNSAKRAGVGVNPFSILRAVLVALAAGWIVALAAGLVLARLQYAEVSRAFPPEQVQSEYESRLDRELRQGPLLLLAQVGVMAGALSWQVGRTARRALRPVWQGAASGIALAAVQGALAVAMRVPLAFIVPLIGVLVGAGVYAGWSAALPPATDHKPDLTH